MGLGLGDGIGRNGIGRNGIGRNGAEPLYVVCIFRKRYMQCTTGPGAKSQKMGNFWEFCVIKVTLQSLRLLLLLIVSCRKILAEQDVLVAPHRNMPARNTLVQPLAMYTNPESKSHNAQRHRQTDRDGRQDDANLLPRSPCVCLYIPINRQADKNLTLVQYKR